MLQNLILWLAFSTLSIFVHHKAEKNCIIVETHFLDTLEQEL